MQRPNIDYTAASHLNFDLNCKLDFDVKADHVEDVNTIYEMVCSAFRITRGAKAIQSNYRDPITELGHRKCLTLYRSLLDKVRLPIVGEYRFFKLGSLARHAVWAIQQGAVSSGIQKDFEQALEKAHDYHMRTEGVTAFARKGLNLSDMKFRMGGDDNAAQLELDTLHSAFAGLNDLVVGRNSGLTYFLDAGSKELIWFEVWDADKAHIPMF